MFICGCFPIGVVSLVHAIKASSLADQGDLRGSQEAEARAKTWAYRSFGLGIAVGVIAVLVLISASTSMANRSGAW